MLGDEVARRFADEAEGSEDGIGEGLGDIADEAVLGLAGQLADLEVKRGGDAQQHGAADIALVALDEVEIARRNADHARQGRLRAAQSLAPRTDADADRCPLSPSSLSTH
jgi:hypothetical protein